ncbi:odorant receptor 63a-like [Dendroctonus ponderosae]|uniref:odorant receptor 63a-like n=1 Tax=Dendroctonus ponderosae TaxID=77166 RepID=UPI00203652BB|nr:odorant receptor 63a-like [Dendroctonus ponderosae]
MDVLFFYFMRSPAIQLEILHHYLKRFDYYTGRMSVEPGNVASNIMMRKCIDMHRKVIKFVDIFNENFRNIMVLDFVQSSVRIASLSAVIIMNESDSVISFGFSLIHFWMALVREYYIYYAGNEITFLSSELVFSVYETDWYKENRQFKFMVKMFMVRAGKPLNINIGPFGNLGFPAFLSILQGSFSYFSLVTGIQKS